MQTTVGQLAALVEGAVEGDANIPILGISNIEDAQDGDITFAENEKLLTSAGRSRASAVIAPASGPVPSLGKPIIRVKNPRFAFAQVLRIFAPEPKVYKGIHPTAVIGENAPVWPQRLRPRPGRDRRQRADGRELRDLPVRVRRRQRHTWR